MAAGQLEERLGEINDVKKDNLAFNVAFQRALFAGFIEFQKIDDTDVASLRPDDEEEDFVDEEETLEDINDDEVVAGHDATQGKSEKVARRADDFIEGLNRVIDRQKDFLNRKCLFVSDEGKEHYFWLATLQNLSRNAIDFTQSASIRASELVFWAAALAVCEREQDELYASGFDAFWSGIDESESRVHRRLASSINRYCKVTGTAGKIISAMGIEYSDDLAHSEAKVRLRWLYNTIGRS